MVGIPVSDLRDRLAKIIKEAAKQYPPGSDIDEGSLGIADALLASEEWQAREAVVEAAMAWIDAPVGMNIIAAAELGLDTFEIARENEKRARANTTLRAALSRLAALKGEHHAP